MDSLHYAIVGGRKFQFSDFHSFPQIYILTSRFDHYCPFHSFQEQQRTLSQHGRGCSGIEYLSLLKIIELINNLP